MLLFQLDDGRIPQQINWRYKPGFSNPLKPRLYTKNEYNDLTQMPVFPYSLRSIYNATGDVGLLREFVPKLIKHFDWWRTNRVLDDTGLVTILHPWESGLDLTPAYDAALGVDSASRARPAWRQMYVALCQSFLAYLQLGNPYRVVLEKLGHPLHMLHSPTQRRGLLKASLGCSYLMNFD